MKKSVISALLSTGLCAAQAHAAFVIDCKLTVYGPGNERPDPVQWQWDGTELRTHYTAPQGDKIFNLTPVHFEERNVDVNGLSQHGNKATLYAFVFEEGGNGDRHARTFFVTESRSAISVKEMSGFTSRAGALLTTTEISYSDCAWRTS